VTVLRSFAPLPTTVWVVSERQVIRPSCAATDTRAAVVDSTTVPCNLLVWSNGATAIPGVKSEKAEELKS